MEALAVCLVLLLVLPAWILLLAFYRHVLWTRSVTVLPLEGLKGYPLIGFLPLLLELRLGVPKGVTTMAHLLTVGMGLAKVFGEKGLFRLNIGVFKQVIVLYSADNVKALLSDPKEVAKSWEYSVIQDFLGVGLLNSPPKEWAKQRRLLSPSFHPSILHDVFQPVVNENSQLLIKNLRSWIPREQATPTEELVALCVLDIITETAMGVKIGAQSGRDVPYFSSLNKVLELTARRIVSPWLWPGLVFWLTPSGWEMRRHIRVVRNFVKEVIPMKKKMLLEEMRKTGVVVEDRPGDGAKEARRHRRPFLELMLIHNMECKEEDRISDQEIEDQTHTFTFGGSDTVTHTVSWTVYFLGLYPEVMQKAFLEVDAIFNGDKERPISIEDLKHMNYIESVIKESQRLCPAVPAVIRELREDFPINGMTIPKGTTMAVLFFALHRDPEVFPDPEIFDPERFLGPSIPQYAYTPFSAGPRGCIGKQYAMMELKTLFADLIRNFSWTSLDQRDVVLPSPDVVTKPHAPLRIVFSERG